jgi:hypothetical protein
MDESEENLEAVDRQFEDQILPPRIVHYCCSLLRIGREVSDAMVAVVVTERTEPKARKSGHRLPDIVGNNHRPPIKNTIKKA